MPRQFVGFSISRSGKPQTSSSVVEPGKIIAGVLKKE
jgi:hypothetical protein